MRTNALTIIAVSMLLALAMPSRAHAAKKMDASQALAWEAAQALYGLGLKIKRGKKSVTIKPGTLKPGTLTQVRFDRYVKDVYIPHLRRASLSLRGTV